MIRDHQPQLFCDLIPNRRSGGWRSAAARARSAQCRRYSEVNDFVRAARHAGTAAADAHTSASVAATAAKHNPDDRPARGSSMSWRRPQEVAEKRATEKVWSKKSEVDLSTCP